jgi:hypothetical protein
MPKLYDYLLTIYDEIMLVWLRPWSHINILFFLVRYTLCGAVSCDFQFVYSEFVWMTSLILSFGIPARHRIRQINYFWMFLQKL